MRIIPHEALPGDPLTGERNQFGLASRCCGIVMVISRAFGCTKLGSANMAPYAAPPKRPTTMRRWIRLGIVVTRQRPRTRNACRRVLTQHFRQRAETTNHHVPPQLARGA